MKKVLSFVLVLALVLSSFSMAFAGSSTELKNLSDVAGNTNEEAIGVNYDLGIVTGNPDGTFQPEKAVTRAEFAAMVTRALAIPQSALAGYANANFKDVNGYAWAVPYLAFSNSKGIMLGDGAGNAMPGKTITVNEAVTMTLRAIGYTANSSELTGVWPANYVTKAQELKLYDDVAKDAIGVDKANAAQIIYNALTVQKVAVNSDGKTEKLWDNSKEVAGKDETTLLSSGLNCTSDDKAVVTISDMDDTIINMAKNIGKYGTVYKNDDKEIVAFISDCDTLVGKFYMDGADVKFKTTDEEKEYNVNATTAAALDVEKSTGSSEVKTKDIADDKTEYTINIDLSGKTIKDIYSVTKWTVADAKQVAASDLEEIKDDQEFLGKEFALEDNDEIDYTQFTLVGAKKLSDIKADDVVYVYADSNDKIRVIEVGTETVEGIVKSYKTAKDHVAVKFAIGANTYKNAEEIINGLTDNSTDVDSISLDEVAESTKVFLDARGYVFSFESTDKATNYAAIKTVGNSSLNDEARVMLADGTEKVMTFDLDGNEYQNNTVAGVIAPERVIGYALNKDGEITDVNTNSAVATQATLSSIKVINYTTGGAVQNAKIASNVVVYTWDKTDYDVTTIDKVEIDEALVSTAGIKVQLLFDDGDKPMEQSKVVAMIIDKDLAKGGTASYAVLNEVNKTANDDDEIVWNLVGYMDGKKFDANTDEENGNFPNKAINPVYTEGKALAVNLYKVKVDSNGQVTEAKLVDYDATNKWGTVDGKKDTDIEVVKELVVDSVDGRDSIKATNGERYALASNVIVYKIDGDDYKLNSGSLKEKDSFTLYEVNDDQDGYDVVIFNRP